MGNKSLTEEQSKEMLAQLSVYFGEPVLPVSKYCGALETWFEKYGQKPDRWLTDSVQPHVLEQLRIDVRKSNLLWRLIYCGEELRTEKCPVHRGKWTGYSWDGCFLGCGETGWLPNELKPKIQGKEDDALLLELLLQNKELKRYTDDQIREKFLSKDPLSQYYGVFGRKLVDEFVSKRVRI